MYGGYFLVLLLMLLFCFDCKLWNLNKVNYVFIFEFDTRHHLDWRQLAEVSRTENMIKTKSLTTNSYHVSAFFFSDYSYGSTLPVIVRMTYSCSTPLFLLA